MCSNKKHIENQKIKAEQDKLASDRESFNKERETSLKIIANGNEELEVTRESFEKYKANEESKLEQESKILSESCARFKELVSQFNSGFVGFPGKE